MEDDEYDDFSSSDDDVSGSSSASSDSDLPYKRRRLAEEHFREFGHFTRCVDNDDSYDDLMRGGSRTNIFADPDDPLSSGDDSRLTPSDSVVESRGHESRERGRSYQSKVKECAREKELSDDDVRIVEVCEPPCRGHSSRQRTQPVIEVQEVMLYRRSSRQRPRRNRRTSRQNRRNHSRQPPAPPPPPPLRARSVPRTEVSPPPSLPQSQVTTRPRPELLGRTALHLAVETGASDVVEVLLEAGAKVDALDEFGRSPLQLAGQRGLVAIVRLLQCAGAGVPDSTSRPRPPVTPRATIY